LMVDMVIISHPNMYGHMPGTALGLGGAQPSTMFGSSNKVLQPIPYDFITPQGAAKDYKDGGQCVKFDSFHGAKDKHKAL
ncbi:hypothetical protein, partial [Escherichia coli]|uniref:hypothetical protein n=1 Tax=Escherichia coli TaxID=562 RepID=UPI001AD916AB